MITLDHMLCTYSIYRLVALKRPCSFNNLEASRQTDDQMRGGSPKQNMGSLDSSSPTSPSAALLRNFTSLSSSVHANSCSHSCDHDAPFSKGYWYMHV